ncbi:MAG: AAA family ATPase [Candidatus Cloacimonetes bacterium]|nr:AAA family ATPase [Candidatus Cloacimonadota bacterium]
MHISKLILRNFRNFHSANISFNKGVNTLIGENGSGKSNLLFALRVLIDDTLPRNFRFRESDFSRKLDSWAGHWIVLSIIMDELDLSEEAQTLTMHACAHMDKENAGSYSAYFRPRLHIRKQLFEYSESKDKTREGLLNILNCITINDYETVYLGRGTGDFSNQEIYRKHVGDFEAILFPDPDKKEEDIFGSFLPKDISLPNEVSCTFVKALRDVESDLRSYNNPLTSLFRGRDKTVSITKQEAITSKIEELNSQINELDEVKEIQVGIEKSIRDTVGATYAPNIDIMSELPSEMDKLLQSLKLWVGDPDDEGYKGKIWELSLGGANLVYLSLKLLEYEKLKTDRIANFLLVEEPEAHIHTHIQKTLFNNLSENKTQVFITTHSTHISSVSKISNVNVLTRGTKESLVFSPSKNLKKKSLQRIERYLDAVRCNLLFAKGVILVEGDAEHILIPEMFKAVFGLSLDEIGITVVNIGSTGFCNVANLFNTERIKKKCAIVTDSDKSIIELPTNQDDDNDFQKHCRASQTAGGERFAKLLEYCNGNDYLEPFFAQFTFEVDLLIADNSYEFVKCLNSMYKASSKAKIEKSTEKLQNEDISISGLEALRLANKEGKGWFALLLAETVNYNTNIPDYIMKAMAFSAPHLSTATIIKSIRYRIDRIMENSTEDIELREEALEFSFEGKTIQDAIADYRTKFNDDQLTKFLNLYGYTES